MLIHPEKLELTTSSGTIAGKHPEINGCLFWDTCKACNWDYRSSSQRLDWI